MNRPFSKVLVANRGEIASRLLRTIRNAGYASVAVYSDADFAAPHVMDADQSIRIGPGPAVDSYLSIKAIIDAALKIGADAIHPGYGFLSENAIFVDACTQEGLVFVGPVAESIRVMGDKRAAKERMMAAGVPCIPGYIGADQSMETLIAEAADVGLPLMIKASAGGGGRGIRLVNDLADFSEAAKSAASEARNAFGDGTLYLEKAIFGARHIEVQIVADTQGTTLHFGDRDCSAQRRNQKVIEEAPSPGITQALRDRICKDAVNAAAAIDYVGAGTVEFLLDADGHHYFLEMNTRLQVEHPVTEEITGVDLVELQLRVATGAPIGLEQADICFRGHAMEARLYAEDPANGFIPCTGRITSWKPVEGPNYRVDGGINTGQEISSFYDPMVAKVIARGDTREEARRRLLRALRETMLLGITNNGYYLQRIVQNQVFATGGVTTNYLGDHPELCEVPKPGALMNALAVLLLTIPEGECLARWRGAGVNNWRIDLENYDFHFTVQRELIGQVKIFTPNVLITLEVISFGEGSMRFKCDGIEEDVCFARHDAGVDVAFRGRCERYSERQSLLDGDEAHGSGELTSPMSGLVIDIRMAEGEVVTSQQTILVLEAMKMEMEIKADVDGVLSSVLVKTGDQVTAQQLLARIEDVDTQ